jgi:hypothetical protein
MTTAVVATSHSPGSVTEVGMSVHCVSADVARVPTLLCDWSRSGSRLFMSTIMLQQNFSFKLYLNVVKYNKSRSQRLDTSLSNYYQVNVHFISFQIMTRGRD